MKVVAGAFAAASLLGGCAAIPRTTGADDIHRFLVAIREGDQAGFAKVVPDPASISRGIALRLCFRTTGRASARDCIDETQKTVPPITLDAFRGIAASYRYAPGRRSAGPIGLPLRGLSHDQVCLTERKSRECVLAFAGYGDDFKLISVGFPERLERP